MPRRRSINRPSATPVAIGEILAETLARRGLSKRLAVASLPTVWPQIVGEPLAAHTSPRTVRHRTLFINVPHSTWTQDLVAEGIGPEIVRRVNDHFQMPLVDTVRFTVGSKRPADEETPRTPAPSPTSRRRPRPPRELTPQDLQEVEALLTPIRDPAVRDALRSLLLKQRRRRG